MNETQRQTRARVLFEVEQLALRLPEGEKAGFLAEVEAKVRELRRSGARRPDGNRFVRLVRERRP